MEFEHFVEDQDVQETELQDDIGRVSDCIEQGVSKRCRGGSFSAEAHSAVRCREETIQKATEKHFGKLGDHI